MKRIESIKSVEDLNRFAADYLKNRFSGNNADNELSDLSQEKQAQIDAYIDKLQSLREDIADMVDPKQKQAAQEMSVLAERYLTDMVKASAAELVSNVVSSSVDNVRKELEGFEDIEVVIPNRVLNEYNNQTNEMAAEQENNTSKVQVCLSAMDSFLYGGSMGDHYSVGKADTADSEKPNVSEEIENEVLAEIGKVAGSEYGKKSTYTEREFVAQLETGPRLTIDMRDVPGLDMDNYKIELNRGVSAEEKYTQWANNTMEQLFHTAYGDRFEEIKASGISMFKGVLIDGKPAEECFNFSVDTASVTKENVEKDAARHIVSMMLDGNHRIDCMDMRENDKGEYVPQRDRMTNVKVVPHVTLGKLSIIDRILKFFGFNVEASKQKKTVEKISFSALKDNDVLSNAKRAASSYQKNRERIQPLLDEKAKSDALEKFLHDNTITAVMGSTAEQFRNNQTCGYITTDDYHANLTDRVVHSTSVLATMTRDGTFRSLATTYAMMKGMTVDDFIKGSQGDAEIATRLQELSHECLEKITIPTREQFAETYEQNFGSKPPEKHDVVGYKGVIQSKFVKDEEFESRYTAVVNAKAEEIFKLVNVDLRQTYERYADSVNKNVDLDDIKSMADNYTAYDMLAKLPKDLFQCTKSGYFESLAKDNPTKVTCQKSRDYLDGMVKTNCVLGYMKIVTNPTVCSNVIDIKASANIARAVQQKIAATTLLKNYCDENGKIRLDDFLKNDETNKALNLENDIRKSLDSVRNERASQVKALASCRDLLLTKTKLADAVGKVPKNIAQALRKDFPDVFKDSGKQPEKTNVKELVHKTPERGRGI